MGDDPDTGPRVFVDRRGSAKPGWMTLGRAAELFIVAAAVISLLFQPITWVTGGLRPQSQIEIDNAKQKTADLSARLDTQIAIEASDKAQILASIDNLRQLFATRLDAMWRPSDFAERDSHLSRLDTVFEGQRDKITDYGYAIKDLQNRYQALTTVPTPGPPRR
jgi:hypothetical protein